MSPNCLVLGCRSKGRLLVYVMLALLVLGLGLPGVALADQPVTESITLPFAGTYPNPCTGELVAVTGNIVVQYRFMFDGDTAHLEYHLSSQGVSGTTATGTKYQAQFLTSDNQNGDIVVPYTGSYTHTQMDTLRLVRQGETTTSLGGDDFYMYLRYHATFNAQNVPTAEVDNVELKCQ